MTTKREICKVCGRGGHITTVYLPNWPVCDECMRSFIKELKEVIEYEEGE